MAGPELKCSIKSILFRSIAMIEIRSDKNLHYEENQVATQIFRKSKVSVKLLFQYSLKQWKARELHFNYEALVSCPDNQKMDMRDR